MKNVVSEWVVEDGLIKFYSGKENIIFSDNHHHFINGFCRLLGLSEEKGKNFVELVSKKAVEIFSSSFSELDVDKKVKVLKLVSKEFFEIENKTQDLNFTNSKILCNHDFDIVYENSIRNNKSYVLAGCSKCEYACLKNINDKSMDLVSYEQEYYEGNDEKLGYGNYLKQSEWRLEKSKRQLRQIQGLLKFLFENFKSKPKVLDVGSGYGFFRKALDDEGLEHDGIEISSFAIDTCKKEFGFNTYQGDLSSFCSSTKNKYDIVVMWDLIEHVTDPINILKEVRSLLYENGICCIRTPNLLSLEREIFRNHYHSFKLEHLYYFSPKSISLALLKAELSPVFLTTETHLLSGFLGKDLSLFSRILKGSDIFLIASK